MREQLSTAEQRREPEHCLNSTTDLRGASGLIQEASRVVHANDVRRILGTRFTILLPHGGEPVAASCRQLRGVRGLGGQAPRRQRDRRAAGG